MNKKIVSDWKLERYVLGELPEDELSAIRAQEALDAEFRGRVEALRRSDAEILERYPAEQAAVRIRNLVEAETAPPPPASAALPWAISRWAIPAAACAALLLALPMGMIVSDPPLSVAGLDGDRVKGFFSAPVREAAIEVWRKEGDDARKLKPDAVAREGDIVQLRYTVPEHCYAALVSVDGRGELYVHLSGEHGMAAMLNPGGPVALKQSYELDDAPHYEVFYLITASADFEIERIKQTLKGAKHPIEELSLPQIRNITAFVLRK